MKDREVLITVLGSTNKLVRVSTEKDVHPKGKELEVYGT